jgi:phage shock protein C
MNRRLYRCRHDRRIAGVAAGVAEFFDLDPTLVRVLWFLSIFVGGLGIFLYIGLAVIVPLEPLTDAPTPGTADEAATEPEGHRHMSRGAGSGRVTTFVGAVLILFGAVALLDMLLPARSDTWRYLWPAFLIGVGVLLVARAVRREPTNL